MEKIISLLITALCALPSVAQNDDTSNLTIQSTIDACIAMRDAVAAGDTAAIRQSSVALRACNTVDFQTLQGATLTTPSLNGHLVFEEAFADSLAAGKNVYDQADEMSRTRTVRGQTSDGSILTKTCFVRAGKSAKYNFQSAGHQELAVVAEAGGLVTMKIHVTNSDGLNQRYNDTKAVKTGLPQRQRVFNLPTAPSSNVELEIINCSKKDCSFVIISN